MVQSPRQLKMFHMALNDTQFKICKKYKTLLSSITKVTRMDYQVSFPQTDQYPEKAVVSNSLTQNHK